MNITHCCESSVAELDVRKELLFPLWLLLEIVLEFLVYEQVAVRFECGHSWGNFVVETWFVSLVGSVEGYWNCVVIWAPVTLSAWVVGVWCG